MKLPEHLTEAEAEIWDATYPLIVRPTLLNAQRLEAYCVERARWLEAEAWIRENGPVLTLRSDKGIVVAMKEAPQLKIARQSQTAALKLVKELQLRTR